jgi:release factor glutamine methyltransferase
MQMPTVADCLRSAALTLAGGSESPRLDAELLLCKVMETSRSGLIVRAADPLAADRRHAFDDLVARRAEGAPIAYLTGTREFWSLTLQVTPDVLVPRPETELLVDHALALLPSGRGASLLDLGTGSGAIAVAIASERPHARVTAVDVSADALAVARRNAEALGVPRIDWRLGSWFDAVPGERFDVIVSNPPYVAAGDPALRALAAEPPLALTPGPTGLEALSTITAAAADHLYPEGWILLEHGCDQAEPVTCLLERHGFARIRTFVDGSGKPRVTAACLPGLHARQPSTVLSPRQEIS